MILCIHVEDVLMFIRSEIFKDEMFSKAEEKMFHHSFSTHVPKIPPDRFEISGNFGLSCRM